MLQLVHLFYIGVDLLNLKRGDGAMQILSGVARPLSHLTERNEIIIILFVSHKTHSSSPCVLEYVHKDLGDDESQKAAAGKRKDPGQRHFLHNFPIDGRQTFGSADAHDGSRLCVGGTHRDTREGG